jgi:hypothetical protein
LGDFVVFDYNNSNLDALARHAPDSVSFEFPIVPALEFFEEAANLQETSRKRDFLLFGAPSARRVEVVNRLLSVGLSARMITGVYGHDLILEIRNSRAVLNIHYYENSKVFEIARCLRPLASGIPVVSEVSDLPSTVDWLSSGVVFSEKDQLGSKCLEILANPRTYYRTFELAMSFSKAPALEVLCRKAVSDAVSALERRVLAS